jgi:hypothetical protein
VGEQWRNSAAAAQTVGFSYLVGSPTVTGSLAEFQSAGITVSSLDFTSPITGGGVGVPLDGNLAANRVTMTFTVSGLNIPNGTEVMLRWSDPDHTGADHGLSVDDVSIIPRAAPTAATVSVSGRVLTGTGRGIPNATVVATLPSGTIMQTKTGLSGYYSFAGLIVGETVVITVSHQRFAFAPQVLSLSEDVQNLNFLAQ